MTVDCAGARLDREQLLVTGAAGLTGTALCAAVAEAFAVHAVSRRPKPPAVPESVCWHQADLSQAGFVRELPRRIDHVVHLAQSSRFREFPEGAPDVFAVNLAATAHLLHWATGARAKHFSLASTGGVYATSTAPLREPDAPPVGGVKGFYAATKFASETLAAAYTGEFAVTSLRPFFLYGRGQEPSMLVPRLVRSVREGVPVRVAGGAGFRFTPTHVSDAVRAVVASLRLDGSHVINVGGPEVLTLRAACEAIGAAVGVAPRFEVIAEEPADLVPDLSLMRGLLAPPTVAFSAGLELL